MKILLTALLGFIILFNFQVTSCISFVFNNYNYITNLRHIVVPREATTKLWLSSNSNHSKSVVFPTTTTTTTTLEDQEKEEKKERALSRKARKIQERKKEYEYRRSLWLEKYGSVEALQRTFGTGPIGGDLSPEQTRALYHTLLPRSLLGMYEMGLMNPEELAPLAYEARIAAKQYARSRCSWTGRLITSIFDQYRNIKKYGRIRFGSTSSSMSWDEIWQKYEAQIVEEVCTEALIQPDDDNHHAPKKLNAKNQPINGEDDDDDDDEETNAQHTYRNNKLCLCDEKTLTMRIYLRILEKSCATNQAFDSLFLKQNNNNNNHNILRIRRKKNTTKKNANANFEEIALKLENDVREILLNPKENQKIIKQEEKLEKEKLKQMEKEMKEKLKLSKKEEKYKRKQEKEEEKRAAAKNKELKKRGVVLVDDDEDEQAPIVVLREEDIRSSKASSSQRWEILRTLIGTRRKFRKMFHHTKHSHKNKGNTK